MNDDHYALIVAIGRYREYAPLRSPESDAMRFVDWLINKGGVPEQNIKLVRATGDGTPVNQDINKAMIELGVRMKQRRGARLYFYYAGHGLGADFKEVALIPADASVDDYYDSFLGIGRCFDFFVRTGFFDEIVAFLDCCRDDVSVEPIGFPWRTDRFDGAKDVNLFALMGATHGNQSHELRTPPLDEIRYRGLMTEVLLDGLNGAGGAIDTATGNVTSDSLSTYVMRRVKAEAGTRAVLQAVDPYAHAEPSMTLAEFAGAPTIALSVTVGAKTAGAAMVLQNLGTMARTPLPIGAVGETLPDVQIAGNTRHQLIVPTLSDWPIIDPTTLGMRCDIHLP